MKERIGKGDNGDLLIDYRHDSFGMLIPLGASNYNFQTTSNFVNVENLEYIPSKLGTKFGYTNPEGDILIEPQYDFARTFKKDVARVKVNNKWGLIDKGGNYLFQPQFDYISATYQDSIIYVMNNDYVGLINKNGNEILPVNKLEIEEFTFLNPHLYKVYKKNKEGIYNAISQQYTFEPVYDGIKIEYSSRYDDRWK